MYDKIISGIGNQISEIYHLQFENPEEDKTEKRKEREGFVKKCIDFFSNSLNLIAYSLLIVIFMRIATIFIINQGQGLYEFGIYKAEFVKKHLAARHPKLKIEIPFHPRKIIRIDSVNSVAIDWKKIHIGKNPVILNQLKKDTSHSFKLTNEQLQQVIAANKSTTYSIYGKPIQLLKYSLWKDFSNDFTNGNINKIQFFLMAVSLLLALWLMKLVLKFCYWLARLISPVSISKMIGLWFMIAWLWSTAGHLFEAKTVHEIIDQLFEFNKSMH
jgi:hypothetical protein